MTENTESQNQAGESTQSMAPPPSPGYASPIPPVAGWGVGSNVDAHTSAPAVYQPPGGPATAPGPQIPTSAPMPWPEASRQAPFQQARYGTGPAPGQPGFGATTVNVGVQTSVMVLGPQKSVGVALLLTFFFGPLGMLYSTILGGVVMFFVTLLAIPLTTGLGLLLTWPICMVWAATAASSTNGRVSTVQNISPR